MASQVIFGKDFPRPKDAAGTDHGAFFRIARMTQNELTVRNGEEEAKVPLVERIRVTKSLHLDARRLIPLSSSRRLESN